MTQGDLSSHADVKSCDEPGRLARSFNVMADQVETTVSTLRRFVSDAAHELWTPLTALRTNLDLALDENSSADRALYLSRAEAMIKRLEELNTPLLGLSRLETDDHTLKESAVDRKEPLCQRSEFYASQAGLIFELELLSAALFVRAGKPDYARHGLPPRTKEMSEYKARAKEREVCSRSNCPHTPKIKKNNHHEEKHSFLPPAWIAFERMRLAHKSAAAERRGHVNAAPL
jgi:signal transduction histidine kinase